MSRIQCRNCEHIQETAQFCRRCGRSLSVRAQAAPSNQTVVAPRERVVIHDSSTLEQCVTALILARVERCNGNVRAAAKSLGIGYTTVYRYVRKTQFQNGTQSTKDSCNENAAM